MNRTRAYALTFAVAAALFASPAEAQQGTSNGEWRVYGGDLRATRATRRWTKSIATMWGNCRSPGGGRHATSDPQPEIENQTVPLMIDGVLYATAGSRRSVVAIDPGVGRDVVDVAHERWRALGSSAPAEFRTGARLLGVGGRPADISL